MQLVQAPPTLSRRGTVGCLSHAWRLVAVVLAGWACSSARPAFAEEAKAPKLPAAVQSEVEKIQKVLEENFRACNEENIRALMATISPTMPGLAEFHNESLKMFADTDVYLSLDSFELIGYRPPFAVARVVQVTLPRDEKDREAGSELQQRYRGNTALLPEWERAVYTQQFKKEGGKWRLYGIIEVPSEWRAPE
jgi:hypothetical protein